MYHVQSHQDRQVYWMHAASTADGSICSCSLEETLACARRSGEACVTNSTVNW